MSDQGLIGSTKSAFLKDLFYVAEQYFTDFAEDRVCTFQTPPYDNYRVYKIEGELYVVSEAQFLGEGAFGKVYVGQNANGECFAIKTERLEWSETDTRAYEQKEVEKDILKETGKARGVEYHHAGQEGTKHIYEVVSALKLEPGDDLFYQIFKKEPNQDGSHDFRDDPPDLLTRTAMALKVAYEMNWLHSMGIIHCDLSSNNIMASVNQSQLGCEVLINSIDFGLAVRLPKDQRSVLLERYSMGGVYSAPEITKGGGVRASNGFIYPSYSEKSDIYAAGQIILSDLGLYHDKDFPEDAKDILKYMRSKSPEARPDLTTVMAVLVSALKEQLENESNPDENIINLIKMCEAHLNQVIPELYEEETTYRDDKTQEVFEMFEEEFLNGSSKVKQSEIQRISAILEEGNLSDDDKLIAIKGYILKHDIKGADDLLKKIHLVSGKARFLGDDGCQFAYENIIKSPELSQFLMEIKADSTVFKESDSNLNHVKHSAYQAIEQLLQDKYSFNDFQANNPGVKLDEIAIKIKHSSSESEVLECCNELRSLQRKACVIALKESINELKSSNNVSAVRKLKSLGEIRKIEFILNGPKSDEEKLLAVKGFIAKNKIEGMGQLIEDIDKLLSEKKSSEQCVSFYNNATKDIQPEPMLLSKRRPLPQRPLPEPPKRARKPNTPMGGSQG